MDESSSSNDDLISMDSDQAREKKAKEKERIMASLIKERPFKKQREIKLLERVAAGELGVKILDRDCTGSFRLVGEDNFLLGQKNMFSVITTTREAVIGSADPQKLFQIMSDAGGHFVQELR